MGIKLATLTYGIPTLIYVIFVVIPMIYEYTAFKATLLLFLLAISFYIR